MTVISTEGAGPGAEFDTEWRAWRAERDRWARAPLGWLSLTGLQWLTDHDVVLEAVPGRWRVAGETVVVSDGAELTLDGRLLGDRTVLTPGEGAAGIEVRHGERLLEVIRRSGRFAVRVHDPAAPGLATFAGIPAYPAQPRWVIIGRFTPFDTDRTVVTGAVVDGLEHHHRAPGTIAFRLGGTEHRLIAFGDPESGLRVLFSDATAGVTTYPGARLLPVGTPATDGSVVLDFNRAQNLPCAFTDYATCPLAPAENRLPVAVEAGEQDPRGGRTAA